MKPLFVERSSFASRLFILFILTIAVVAIDHWFNGFKLLHYAAGTIAKPYYQISNAPKQVVQSFSDKLKGRDTLYADNQRLLARERILDAKLQKMAALSAENGRLRALLNSKAILGADNIVVAELIGVSSDADRHLIVINKGATDKVFEGQPVIDANGLVGQVIEVFHSSSRVMLITDERHSVPVQVSRHGLRAIAEGGGFMDELVLSNVGSTADIVVGDLLSSSGLGGRFPEGYPVARVSKIKQDASSPFLQVSAKPMAELSRVRYLLLVFPEGLQ